jgi:uncharacterized membrane protein YqjE
MASSVEQRIAPPIAVSLERTIDLAQQVAIDEFRLWQLELQERLSDALRRGLAVGLGALCLIVAWVVAWAAVVVALEPWFSLEARLLMLAISQLLLGAVAVWFGLRSRRAAK